MEHLEVFSAFDDDTGEYIIMVRSHERAEVCGARIFKATPHPDVKFRHATQFDAEKDVAKIKRYLCDGRGYAGKYREELMGVARKIV